MRNGSLEVTFFRLYVRKFYEIQFFWKIELSMGHFIWLYSMGQNEREVNRKSTGSGSEVKYEGSIIVGRLHLAIF